MSDLLERLKTALADRYRVDREIGRGGMAHVFLAHDLKLDRLVALKVLRPDLAAVLGGSRFLREITLAAKLEHPHILAIYDSGEADGILYYVMPYVEGESLRDRLAREKQLPVEDALRISREVADALSYAHAHGVIHRDIKPENILLESGHAVVADFGIARAVDAAGGDRLTETGVMLGTPAYMSPEQAAGSRDPDGRSDLYSLGCVLYEMLTGRPPFVGPTIESVVAQHLAAEPPNITDIRPSVPSWAVAALERSLAKTPADRFNPVAQFAEAIAPRAAAAEPVTVVARPRRRRGALIAGATLVVVVVGAVLVITLRNGGPGVSEQLLAGIEMAAKEGRLNDVYSGLAAAGLTLDDARVRPLLGRVAGTVSVETDPRDVPVSAWRVEPIATFASHREIPLGKTPVTGRRLVAGEYLLRLRPAGRDTLTLLVDVAVGGDLRVQHTLLPADAGWEGMVLVERGPSPVDSSGAPLPAFLIDRDEVTNAQFAKFVTAGGYADSAYWPPTLLMHGHPVPWARAVRAFVDRSGLPGPRDWSSGTFSPDRADHPVTGVSWYEAAAYARWVGKELPSRAQWYRAALGDTAHTYPWGRDARSATQRANFNLSGTTPVGSFPLGVSPFGCLDMAGNVREWLQDPANAGAQFYVAGGSWQDPIYMFFGDHLESFDPGFTGPALGFRLVTRVPSGR